MGTLSDILNGQTGETVGTAPGLSSVLPDAPPDPVLMENPFLGIEEAGPAPTAGAIPAAGNPSGGLTAGAMGMQILGGLLKGMAAYQAGEQNATIAERNATIARMAAGDARARGHVAAQVMLLRGSQLASRQKAAYAGAGVDVSSGSAVQAQADTKGMSAFDALTAENDAARTAWGYEQRGKQFDELAAIDRARGRNQLGESILGGATGAATIGTDYLFRTS